jgi:hypothetical protein
MLPMGEREKIGSNRPGRFPPRGPGASYRLVAAVLVIGANTVLRLTVHAIDRQPVDFTRGGAALPDLHRVLRCPPLRYPS